MTVNKRQKEKARQERNKDKEQKRDQRRTERQNRPASEGGEDPDLAGIIPGPQPIPDEQDS